MRMDDPASPQTAVSSTSFVSSPAPSPSSSQRLDPIRRKPVPTGYPERDDKGDSTLVHSVEGDETLLGGVESRDGHTEGAKEKGKAPATEFSPHDFRRPSTESAHSFPPPASRTSFQYIPNSLPSPASAYSYAPTSPLFASPPTAPAPIPTPASLARGRTSYQDEEQKYAGLTSRPSLHSQRSSVAPENVFGTPPVGFVLELFGCSGGVVDQVCFCRTIGINKPREVVRVERDYTGGELPFFWSGWIFELEGRVRPLSLWDWETRADSSST